MNNLIIYLAGPMEDVLDNGTQWRDRITLQLKELFGNKIEIQDPTKSEGEKIGLGDECLTVSQAKEKMHGWKSSGCYEKFDPASKAIIDTDIACVDRGTFIIAYLKFKNKKGDKVQMGGTIGELQHAYDHNIKIYAVCYDNVTDMNTWVLGIVRNKGNKLYKNFSQLLEAIKEDYKEHVLTEKDKKKLEDRNKAIKEIENTKKQLQELQKQIIEKENKLKQLKENKEDKK